MMVQQKMLCASQRTCKKSDPSSGGALEDDNNAENLKDTEVSAVTWRNYSDSSTTLASSNLGGTGDRFVIMPSLCLDCSTLSTFPEINTEDLDMTALPPVDSCKIREKALVGPDEDYFGKSVIGKSSMRAPFLHLSCVNSFENDESNWKVLLIRYFSRNPVTRIEYPLLMLSEPDPTSSAYRSAKVSDGIKDAPRKARKKAPRRRGKHNDSLSICGSTDLNCQNGSLKSEAKGIKDMCAGAVSLPNIMRKNISGINYNKNNSGMSKPIRSRTDLIEISEGELPDDGTGGICRKSVTYSDLYKSLLLDAACPVSDGDVTCREQHDLKLSNDEGTGVGILNLELHGVKMEISSSKDVSHSALEHCDQSCRTKHIKQTTEGDQVSHELGKKEHRSRKAPRESGAHKIGSIGNQNGHNGKENTHSIWKKVQRNDADALNNKNITQSSNECKLVPSHRKHLVPTTCLLSEPEESNLAQLKAPRREKRRKGLRSKQEVHSSCGKKSNAITGSSCVPSIVNVEQNGVLGSRQYGSGNQSRSFPRMSSRVAFQAKKVEFVTYKPVQKPEAALRNLVAYHSPQAVPILVSQVTERPPDLSFQKYSYPDTSNEHKEVSFDNDENTMMVKDMPSTDCCHGKVGSGDLPQNCLRVGANPFSMPNLSQSALPLEELKLTNESLSSDGTREQKSFARPSLPCSDKVNHSSQHLKNPNTINSEAERSVESFDGNTPSLKDFGTHTSSKNLTCEFKNQILFSSGSDTVKVLQAVNDAYRSQLASEAIQTVLGGPIAAFEKFICSASPVLCELKNFNNCQMCSPRYAFGASICKHDTPNLPLGSIWKWYEKHGSCGLEVRAEDFEHSMRLGMDQFAFRAYFVPYLSAVQLFKEHRTHPKDVKEDHNSKNETTESSSRVGLATVFPMLVPQPCLVKSSSHCEMNGVSQEESSPLCMNEAIHDQQINSRFSDGVELLFEYFESEQPQHRRPLFEMVKELTGGERPLKSRLYGDPCNLDSLGLHDLHPNSWYSVAWYPIYRIPDGKLRAAFLTYHSLGHLVPRSPTFGSHSADTYVVCPVVGLQPYNAQGECWFRPRQPKGCQNNNASDADPSYILKERIRTLEQTASAMARATLTTGDEVYVNRQPDYEFFLSRRY